MKPDWKKISARPGKPPGKYTLNVAQYGEPLAVVNIFHESEKHVWRMTAYSHLPGLRIHDLSLQTRKVDEAKAKVVDIILEQIRTQKELLGELDTEFRKLALPEVAQCPSCGDGMISDENKAFGTTILWFCDNADCPSNKSK